MFLNRHEDIFSQCIIDRLGKGPCWSWLASLCTGGGWLVLLTHLGTGTGIKNFLKKRKKGKGKYHSSLVKKRDLFVIIVWPPPLLDPFLSDMRSNFKRRIITNFLCFETSRMFDIHCKNPLFVESIQNPTASKIPMLLLSLLCTGCEGSQ